MMGRLLEQAASPRVLNHAWRWVRKDPGLWMPGLPMQGMQADVVRHMVEVGRELASGRYRVGAMRCFQIDKGTGEKRLICASDVRDKLVQRAILSVIEPLGEAIFLDMSYGYRPGRTVEMALACLREHTLDGLVWLVDADIQACFDSIRHRIALKRLWRLTNDKALVGLVGDWLESRPADCQPCGPGRGLPQGMVLSPFLCNLVLHDFDCLLKKQQIAAVRFADDFVLLVRSEAQAGRAMALAERALARLDLTLHPGKTRVLRSNKRYRFLGRRLPDARPRFKP